MSWESPTTIYMVYVTDNQYSESSKKLIYSPAVARQGYVIYNPKITMEINKIGSFEFTLPKTNPEYDNVRSMESCIIVEKYYNDPVHYDPENNNPISEVWRGRVISRETDFYSNAQIVCEGILGALRDHIVIGGMKALTDPKLYTQHGLSLDGVLYKVGLIIDNPGTRWTSTSNLYREITLQPSGAILSNSNHPIYKNEGIYAIEQYEETENITCLDALNMLIEKYPIFLRHSDPYFSVNTPQTIHYSVIDDHEYVSNQKIEFGSNLLDLSEMINFSSLYTLAWAFGKENKSKVKLNLSTLKGYDDGTFQIPENLLPGLDLKTTGNLNDIYYGPIVHKELVNAYGYIEKVLDFPEISKAEELRDKAISQFKKDVDYSVQINLKAVDLSLINVDYNEFEVGDFVQVISVPHGINTNTICSKIVLDLESPSNNEYSFGLNFKSLTDRQAKTDKQNSQLFDAAKNSIYQEKE